MLISIEREGMGDAWRRKQTVYERKECCWDLSRFVITIYPAVPRLFSSHSCSTLRLPLPCPAPLIFLRTYPAVRLSALRLDYHLPYCKPLIFLCTPALPLFFFALLAVPLCFSAVTLLCPYFFFVLTLLCPFFLGTYCHGLGPSTIAWSSPQARRSDHRRLEGLIIKG